MDYPQNYQSSVDRLNNRIQAYLDVAYPDAPKGVIHAHSESIAQSDDTPRPENEANPTGRHNMHGVALVINTSSASPIKAYDLIQKVSGGKNLIGTHACAIDGDGTKQMLRINNAFLGPISHAFESATASLAGPQASAAR